MTLRLLTYSCAAVIYLKKSLFTMQWQRYADTRKSNMIIKKRKMFIRYDWLILRKTTVTPVYCVKCVNLWCITFYMQLIINYWVTSRREAMRCCWLFTLLIFDTKPQILPSVYRVVQKKRGHSTFSQISRKQLKISKWFFAHIKASVCRTWHIHTNFSNSFYSVAPSGEYW